MLDFSLLADSLKASANSQMIHALLLFGIGSSLTGVKRRITGSLILTGLLLFSGMMWLSLITYIRF